MKDPKIRDRAHAYIGRAVLEVVVVGPLDQELYPGVWMCSLENSPALLEIHRFQLRKIKKKRTLFIARFSGPTLTDSGLSLPMQSLEEAAGLAGRQKLEEIFEVQEVRKYDIDQIPAKPAGIESLAAIYERQRIEKKIDPQKK